MVLNDPSPEDIAALQHEQEQEDIRRELRTSATKKQVRKADPSPRDIEALANEQTDRDLQREFEAHERGSRTLAQYRQARDNDAVVQALRNGPSREQVREIEDEELLGVFSRRENYYRTPVQKARDKIEDARETFSALKTKYWDLTPEQKAQQQRDIAARTKQVSQRRMSAIEFTGGLIGARPASRSMGGLLFGGGFTAPPKSQKSSNKKQRAQELRQERMNQRGMASPFEYGGLGNLMGTGSVKGKRKGGGGFFGGLF